MSNNNNHQLGEAPWLHVVISTGFGVGFGLGVQGHLEVSLRYLSG